MYLLSDLAGELASYVQSVDADPARLAAVQERRSALGRLIRAYGYGGPFGLSKAVAQLPADYPGGSAAFPDGSAAAGSAGQGELAVVVQGTAAAVLDWGRHAATRLTELDGDDDTVTELTAAEAQLAAEVSDLAARLSQLRDEAAERFAGDVTTELAALAMPHARISAVISRLAEPGPMASMTLSCGWRPTQERHSCR